MPLVATCSAAISAACHRPEQDVDAHLLPVQWGIITTSETPARTAFTTWRDVRAPRGDEIIVGFEEYGRNIGLVSGIFSKAIRFFRKISKREKRLD